jgi:uncharacterized cupredoxin-like copper-binding protein
VLVAIVVGLVVWSPPTVGDVAVSLKDYKIVMPATISAGHHTFGTTNVAKQPHELVVFRTDLPADSLPVDADGAVIEDSPQLTTVVDSGADIAPGKTRAISGTLSPGHYVAVCNISDHYKLGMYTNLTVK